MKKTIILLFLVLSSGFAMAQITVNFTVIRASDFVTPLAGASVTLLGETKISGPEGKVVFTIPVPAEETYYDYTVSANEFVTFNGQLYASSEFLVKDETVYLNPAYSISFTVLDKNEVAIPGASITINDQSFLTGADGKANSGKIYRGGWYEYTYTITADGYADFSSTVTITDQDVIVDPVMLNLAYNISINVQDESSLPVTDAMVTLGNETLNTETNGTVVFHKKINGEYHFQISKSAYIDASGSLTVADGNTSTLQTLSNGYDLSFTVINGAEGSTGLANDTITIGSISKVTNTEGTAVFGVAPGTISFTNKKSGFIDMPVSVDVVDQNISRTIYMIPTYTVIFTVLDGMSYMPIEGASVTFNNNSVLSDVNGIVSFSALSPSEIDYSFTVTSENGYNDFEGTVSLPLSSPYSDQFNLVNQSVVLIKPGITIALTNGMMMYFGGASVQVNGIDYMYDSGMGSAYIQIAPGDYPYIIIPEDETRAILKGMLTVGPSGFDYLSIDAVEGFKVEIYAVDKDNNPLTGARVIFAGETINTDETGDAIFIRKPGGDFTYSISMDGYRSVENAALSVVTSDVVEIASLHINGYLVNFHVTDGANAIAGANVEFEGVILATDANGNVTFEGNEPGSFDYSVSKNGFIVYQGTVGIIDQDVTKEIVLITDGIKNFNTGSISIYPNPVVNIMKVTMADTNTGIVRISVINLSGKVMVSSRFGLNKNSAELNIQNLPSGSYIVRIQTNESEKVLEVIKK